jgi:hypothetical protein
VNEDTSPVPQKFPNAVDKIRAIWCTKYSFRSLTHNKRRRSWSRGQIYSGESSLMLHVRRIPKLNAGYQAVGNGKLERQYRRLGRGHLSSVDKGTSVAWLHCHFSVFKCSEKDGEGDESTIMGSVDTSSCIISCMLHKIGFGKLVFSPTNPAILCHINAFQCNCFVSHAVLVIPSIIVAQLHEAVSV